MTLILLLALAGYLGYRIGRRVERGEHEAELDRIEEQRAARGARPGTVRLKPLRIRR